MRPSSVSPFTGHHLPFIGFSFTENRYVGAAHELLVLKWSCRQDNQSSNWQRSKLSRFIFNIIYVSVEWVTNIS